MNFIDVKFVTQLKDMAQEVSQRKCKNALGQMFLVKIALIKSTLLEWFNKKIKSQHLELDLLIKNKYDQKNPINRQEDKRVICKMLLKIEVTNQNTPNPKMSYSDFFIRFEHKFFRNIYSDEEIQQSPQICTLEKYYETYQKFIKISVSLLPILGSNMNQDEDQFDLDLKDFLQEKYLEIDLEELKSKIDDGEIKNIVKKTNGNKIPKFCLKLYAFVYDALIDFPESNFMYNTITTTNFFRNVQRLIKVKIHLHHSHITGKILGYTHDF